MSRYIEITNDIKSHASVEWLTPSQSRLLGDLNRLFRTQSVVNIHGPAGVGKTFLGWVASRELNFKYLPHPRCFSSFMSGDRAEGMTVDNASERRRAFRDLLKEGQLRGCPKLLLLSSQPIQDTLPALELQCTEEDSLQVITRLLPQKPGDFPNETPYLWQIVWHWIHEK